MDTTLPPYEATHDELWALSALASTIDGVRFRVWGIQPDVQHERPAGFNRTMLDVISVMRRGEQAFIAAIKQALTQTAPTLTTDFNTQPRSFVQSPEQELGTFLVAREQSLSILRGLTIDQWKRTITDPNLGVRTLAELAVERASSDAAHLEELARMRQALTRNDHMQVR